MPPPWLAPTTAVSLAGLLSGCAVTWQQSDRVVTAGFIWLEYSPPHTTTASPGSATVPSLSLFTVTIPYSPTVVSQTYLGLGAQFAPFEHGVSLGYQNDIRVYPPASGTLDLDFSPAHPFSTQIALNQATQIHD